MEACIEVMRPFGLRPRALVFPHNFCEYSHLPLLEDLGITSVRHRDDHVRLSYPERTESGVYKIYESMNLRVPRHYEYSDKAKIFIEKAIARKAAYAVWFHPSDPIEVFDGPFRRILQYVDSQRRSGRLWVTTMSDLSAYCEARKQLKLSVTWENASLTIRPDTSSFDNHRYGTPEITLVLPLAAAPKSVSLELAGGERQPIEIDMSSEIKSSPLTVNLPIKARALHVMFSDHVNPLRA
jgi:hypothetical protein